MNRLRAAFTGICLLLAGCGGGSITIAHFSGDDDVFFISTGLRLPGGSEALDASVIALALHDSVAGAERLVAAAGAHQQIAGPVGAAVVTACPAGSISTRKTGPDAFVLVAQDCQLVAGDPLVYDGTWFFSITSNGYGAAGECAAGTSCVLTATVDTRLAAFGYGWPGMRAVGRGWRQETSAGGVTQGEARAGGEATVIAGSTFSVTGTRERLQTVDFRVEGDRARRTLQVTAPVRATLTVEPLQLVAAVDQDADGAADTSFVVPWDWIAD